MDINRVILIKPLKNQSIVWFKNTNTYVLVAHETAQIIQQYLKGTKNDSLKNWIKETLNLSEKEIQLLLPPVLKRVKELNKKKDKTVIRLEFKPTNSPAVVKYYQINNTCFKVGFQTDTLAFLIHPKFEHLEVKGISKHNHHFEVFLIENKIVLNVDGNFVGSWSADEIHYFQGKFSMKLVEKLYKKNESALMGVFHASAISNGTRNIMFLGDSGNGKSTLAALLVSQGYTLFADDFVPVEAKTQQVYYFPAAISIKEKALETLFPLFPELKNTPQIDLKYINKSVRYLVAPPLKERDIFHLPCQILVFVKYKKDADLKIEKISKEEAFQKFIPDSWLSPLAENAQHFLEWFSSLSCYSLTYSDNAQMYKVVKKLYKDDL